MILLADAFRDMTLSVVLNVSCGEKKLSFLQLNKNINRLFSQLARVLSEK
jgi:hypothetical protein